MIYNIKIDATISSKLSKKKLESQLVIALYDVNSQYSKFDGVDEDLEVIDYNKTDAIIIKKKNIKIKLPIIINKKLKNIY